MSLILQITQLEHGKNLPLPKYGTVDAAGFDLTAGITRDLVIEPSRRALIPTGICIAIPRGYEGQIRPRSGLSLKHGITVLNAPGTIDADYRGEIQVVLINLSDTPFTVTRGMRVAQMVIAPIKQVSISLVEALPNDTERGAQGFGSTGLVG
ncbi:MAG: dUTP diphosphatase [Alphaproteobacteria bacterium]